jgi:translation elongation factor EF-4
MPALLGLDLLSRCAGTNYEVNEVGLLAPDPFPTGELLTGQVGYMLVGMKDTRSGDWPACLPAHPLASPLCLHGTCCCLCS